MADRAGQGLNRRPLATRDWPAARRLAAWLAARDVAPNAISLGGLAFGCLSGVALALTAEWPEWERVWWLLAAGLIQFRLLANLMDGMVAQQAGRASALGELYNELPDRVSDAATLIGLGYAAGGNSTLGFLAACLAIFTAYIRAMGCVAGAGQEFCGPMAKQQRMFLVTLLAAYSTVAPADWQPHWGEDGRWGLASAVLGIIICGCVITAIRRLRRISATVARNSP